MDRNDHGQPAGQNTGHKVRRPRAARACDLCRVKKNKCDELYPCTYCKDRKAECVYRGQRRFMPEYVRHLEDLVRQLSAAQGQQQTETLGDVSHVGQEPPASQHDDSPRDSNPPRVNMGGIDNISTVTTGSRQNAGQEVSGVNRHTHNVEFYGRSSSVALLSQVQRSGVESAIATEEGTDAGAIVSNLHNPAFSPAGLENNGEEASSPTKPSHYPQCRSFLEGFFSSIHYIHPIVDKAEFQRQCELLWSRNGEAKKSSSFIALYYSVLSLGALVGLRDDEPVGGIGNVQWSRKFFDEARSRCNKLGTVTDLHMVQCYFFMAKVCQNELNAHWSYMYTGLAVRTALAMGINREPSPDTTKDLTQLRAESRTWWGLYSLETEISFAMGRPDTLGADAYHNRRFPAVRDAEASSPVNAGLELLDAPYCAIIKPMVDFSRITRKVCLGIYLQDNSTPRTVVIAKQIEQELDAWVDSIPLPIRPRTKALDQPESLKSAKESKWMKRQKLVLLIRYLNLKILLFGSVLLTSTPAERASMPQSVEAIQKCLDAAQQTIRVIYQVYQHHDFFHTWFYNTTYTVFAASIILVYIAQGATQSEIDSLLKFVGMAIEILETMDECVVAAKAAQMLHRATKNAENKFSSPAANAITTNTNHSVPAPGQEAMFHLNQCWGPLNFVGGEMELDLSVFHMGEWELGDSLLVAVGQGELPS